MNMDQLVQLAAQIAAAKASAIPGWRAVIRDLEHRKAGIEQQIKEASNVEKRLATYQKATEATKDENPPCPNCWMHREQDLALMPITSDTPDEVYYGCMNCGFEASFPAQSVRSQTRVFSARSTRRVA